MDKRITYDSPCRCVVCIQENNGDELKYATIFFRINRGMGLVGSQGNPPCTNQRFDCATESVNQPSLYVNHRCLPIVCSPFLTVHLDCLR